MSEDQSLIILYEKMLPSYLSREGLRPPLIAKHHDNTVTVASLFVPGEDIFDIAMNKFMTDLTVKELVFGVDRFTKPDQGTKYADVFTVYWWQGPRANIDYGFKFGVINYRPPPDKVIEPIDWDNAFWHKTMAAIVHDRHAAAKQSIAEMMATHPEKVQSIIAEFQKRARETRGET